MTKAALVERVDEWTAVREQALVDAARSDTGAAIRYHRSSDVDAELARLVAAENICCVVGEISWDLEFDDDIATVVIALPEGLRDSAEAAVIYNLLSGDEDIEM